MYIVSYDMLGVEVEKSIGRMLEARRLLCSLTVFSFLS